MPPNGLLAWSLFVDVDMLWLDQCVGTAAIEREAELELVRGLNVIGWHPIIGLSGLIGFVGFIEFIEWIGFVEFMEFIEFMTSNEAASGLRAPKDAASGLSALADVVATLMVLLIGPIDGIKVDGDCDN